MNEIGLYIKKLRKEKGITQQQLADKLSVSFQAVSKWETGETLPDTGLILDLCNELGTTADALLNGGTVYRNTKEDLKPMQEYFKIMLDQLMFNMTNYIIYSKPNEGIHWDDKIEAFEKMIDFYKFIIGDNLLDFNGDVAYLYRIIATYKIAQGKKEETLDVLEKMCYHIELDSKVKDLSVKN